MSKYARDEFDAVEENSARHGVHRSSLEPQRRSLMPLMIVGVAALCVGALAFFIMPKVLDNTAAPALETAIASASVSPSAPPSAEPTATQDPTTAPVETPTPTPTPDSVVNKATPVAIFNAVGTPGLAGRYSGLVINDGWSVSQSANWAGQAQTTSVIFYNGIEQKANAEALSALLNIPTVVDTADLGLPLAVVLGPGA
ncbi:LytR cell envelope-related transcriptional attenuator [Arthrobacter alpinus]|uniref:LytR cell envelope-related transcriptional attenuator n=1 Tax=Arthrobacter alpinus TaxID=656366 RepID=A0A1H5L901_9MICC|nr:LytR C-terminal domain-containing protein [Arthrobacter alpinus]SEE73569.1 LytR cell envelope-related transcriptional attenuator [Arthrobacter alpinus]